MRTTSHLGQAIAAIVGVALLIGAVVACSHHGPDHDNPVVTGPVTGTGHQAASVARAYQFLNLMMDLHTDGTTPRLVQSYLGGLLGLDGDTSSAIYDDALVIDAYLAEGTQTTARAGVIGNGLLYLQAHDPSHHGRIMDQYQPTALEHPGDIRVTAPTSSTGDMAWAGDALAQLYSATGRRSYLDGAMAIGNWIYAHCRDDRGPGGYTVANRIGKQDRMEVNRAQYRRVRIFPAAGQGHRESCLVVEISVGATVHRGHVGHHGGPVLSGQQQ